MLLQRQRVLIRTGARSDLVFCSRALFSMFGNFSMASRPGLATRAPLGQRRLATYPLSSKSDVPSTVWTLILQRSSTPMISVLLMPQ